MIGRPEARFQVKGLAASKRPADPTWRRSRNMLSGLARQQQQGTAFFRRRDPQEKCGICFRLLESEVPFRETASSKGVFEHDNCRHACMHAYTYLLELPPFLSGLFFFYESPIYQNGRFITHLNAGSAYILPFSCAYQQVWSQKKKIFYSTLCWALFQSAQLISYGAHDEFCGFAPNQAAGSIVGVV